MAEPCVHHLKTWYEPFQALWDKRKRYEIRNNDRNFQIGDILILREYENSVMENVPVDDPSRYTGRAIFATVTYITGEEKFGLPPGVVVMSIQEGMRCKKFEPA